ncbi:TonB-dependent receptor [Flavobacteriaceae bacterium]|nr:TonB-dependent receptor [Flavobacteriaceae bacterium]
MRFALLMVFSVFSQMNASSDVKTPKISLEMEGFDVTEVFKKIESITEFNFFYNNDDILFHQKVSISVKDKELNFVLDQLFMNIPFEYVIKDKQIVVTKNESFSVAKEKNKTEGKKIAQQSVEGVVLDANGQPLPGASVVEKGTVNGTQTDFDGNFSLAVTDQNAVLVFSYIGHQSQEINVNSQSTFEVRLQEDAAKLDEVVIVGYGSVRKGDVSTSVGVVNADDLAEQLTTGFDQALTGKVAGVQVLQTSGSPGGNISIRVRGSASISAGNDPLYVVDGVPLSGGSRASGGKTSTYETDTNPLNSINTNDIESIQILKDAAAAAIYGSRGSNGVVLITTKKGKLGKLKVNYSSNFGIQSVTKKIDLLDAYQGSEITLEARNNTYQDYLDNNSLTGSSTDSNEVRNTKGAPASSFIPNEIRPYLAGTAGLTDTDWQDEIFRSAIYTNHTVSLSGGSDKVRYFVSGNYLNQEGVVISSGFKKYSSRLNLDVTSGKLHAGINITPTYSVTDKVNSDGRYADEGIVAIALGMSPIFPVYNPDGSFNFSGNKDNGSATWTSLSQTNQVNPVAVAVLSQDELSQFNLLGNVFLEYELIEGLKYKLSLGTDVNSFRRDFYRPAELEKRGTAGPSNPIGYSRTDQLINWIAENTLNYSKYWDKHFVNALVGYSAQKNQLRSNELNATNFPNDLVETLNAGTVTDGETRVEEFSLLSYLTRVQYTYDGKYLFTGSIRADGSSRFGAKNKWGYFPSVSFAWKAINESFLEDSNVFSDLRLRASYGVTGNFDIGNYAAQGLISASNYGSLNGVSPFTASNPDLTWERTLSTNFGLNVGLFDNKLTLEVDHYISKTQDLLLQVPVSVVSGFDTSLQNIGRVNNTGWEFLLGINNNDHDLKWNLNFNIAFNENEVKELGPEGKPIIAKGGAKNYFITQIGDAIGSYYTLKTNGIFETQEELDSFPHHANTRVGDIRYVDVNGDGKIDESGDRTITGSYNPDYTFGINGGLNYGDFDLGFNIQGSQGNEVFNILNRYINNVEGNFNNKVEVLNRWISPSEPGNGTVYRANRVAAGSNGTSSDWHIEDGSYIRLQNVSLGYNLPESVLESLQLDKLRVSLSGQNVFTISDYSGYNPEVSGRRTNTAPGEDYGTYPLAKTFSVGLNVSF